MMNRYDIQFFWQDHGPRVIKSGLLGLALLAVLVTSVWMLGFRVRKPPNIFDAPLDNVMSFFVHEDFNRLSVEERMELLAQFAQRFQSMDQSDSAVLAGFMAGLTGRTREQLMDNARILARDVLKEGAEDYLSLPPDERAAFLDQWMMQWIMFGDRVSGQESSRTPEERLARMREQGQRDQERAAERAGGMTLNEGDAVRFLDFWRNEVEGIASPREQGQIFRFMMDLRDHLSQP